MKGTKMKPLAISALAGVLACFAVAAQAAPLSGVANFANSPAAKLERVHYYYHHHRHHYRWHHHRHYHHY
jgi:hypothetical protein